MAPRLSRGYEGGLFGGNMVSVGAPSDLGLRNVRAACHLLGACAPAKRRWQGPLGRRAEEGSVWGLVLGRRSLSGHRIQFIGEALQDFQRHLRPIPDQPLQTLVLKD